MIYLKKWAYWRILRLLANSRKYSYSIFSKIERKNELDDIQNLVFKISLKLIHDKKSTLLNVNGFYQIKNDQYTITIKQRSNSFCIQLIEVNKNGIANSFNEVYDLDHMKSFIDNFNREVLKRMKINQKINESEVIKHLNLVLEIKN